MPPWYDKLISLTGLDAAREDRILGVLEREILELHFGRVGQPIRVDLFRLPDGRRQLVFKMADFGNRWVGFIPCSPANEAVLADFLSRAERYIHPDTVPLGLFRRMLLAIKWPRRLETMANLPDQHLKATIALKLVEAGGRCQLAFSIRSPGRMLLRRGPWTPSMAAQWKTLLLLLRENLNRAWAFKE